MKTTKLITGIMAIVFSVFFTLLIVGTLRQSTGLTSFTNILLFVSCLTAGIISVSTSNNNNKWVYCLNAILYCICGFITLIYIGNISEYQVTLITFFAIVYFCLSIINLIFLFYISYYKNKRIETINIDSNSITCPLCHTIFYGNLCPTCGTNPLLPIKKCLYCGTKSQDLKCPKCHTQILNSIEEVLRFKNFRIDKSIKGKYGSVFVDDAKQLCCIYDNEKQSVNYIAPYKKIIKVELYKDGEAITSSNFNQALLGGLLFGATGAVIGASTSKSTQNVCNYMCINVYLDDLQKPLINIDILKSPANTNSIVYKECISFAKTIISTFEYMINKPSQDNESIV